jgi:hypothetical protein
MQEALAQIKQRLIENGIASEVHATPSSSRAGRVTVKIILAPGGLPAAQNPVDSVRDAVVEAGLVYDSMAYFPGSDAAVLIEAPLAENANCPTKDQPTKDQ